MISLHKIIGFAHKYVRPPIVKTYSRKVKEVIGGMLGHNGKEREGTSYE